MTDFPGVLILGLYFGVQIIFLIQGIHRYFLTFLYLRHRKNLLDVPETFHKLPFVTIQLPIYNERYVVRRLVQSVSQFDYPHDRFEIQVLDDSTDETQDIAQEIVEETAGRGINIVYLHRQNREGFKAGALNHGLNGARGDLIAVFDADFVPRPDFLKKTVNYFMDPEIGMIQTRWTYLNRDYSLFTILQSIFLDGHFVIEQTSRNRSGRFFNFNGTAGIWRKECLLDAGSWEYDTLTEDLDISIRAQLKGWRFIYLKDVLSPSELPVEMNGFKSQQHRWAKGAIQNAIKLLPKIMRSSVPWYVKIETFFHLTNNISYPLMVLMGILMFPAMVILNSQGGLYILFIHFPFLIGSTLSLACFYTVSQYEAYEDWKRGLLRLPLLMALGIGIAPNNGKAVLEALIGKNSPFVRTPKFGVQRRGDKWKEKIYRGEFSYITLLEIAMSLYFAVSLVLAFELGIYLSIPFLVVFALGSAYVPIVSVIQIIQRIWKVERRITNQTNLMPHINKDSMKLAEEIEDGYGARAVR